MRADNRLNKTGAPSERMHGRKRKMVVIAAEKRGCREIQRRDRRKENGTPRKAGTDLNSGKLNNRPEEPASQALSRQSNRVKYASSRGKLAYWTARLQLFALKSPSNEGRGLPDM